VLPPEIWNFLLLKSKTTDGDHTVDKEFNIKLVICLGYLVFSIAGIQALAFG
jgi:hypothetical protein